MRERSADCPIGAHVPENSAEPNCRCRQRGDCVTSIVRNQEGAIRPARYDLTGVIAASAGALALAALAAALLQPILLWALLAAVAVLGALALTCAFPVPASVGWLVLAGSTPEMWLGDLA